MRKISERVETHLKKAGRALQLGGGKADIPNSLICRGINRENLISNGLDMTFPTVASRARLFLRHGTVLKLLSH